MINGRYTVSVNKDFPLTITFTGMFLIDSWQYNGTLIYTSSDSGITWKLNIVSIVEEEKSDIETLIKTKEFELQQLKKRYEAIHDS